VNKHFPEMRAVVAADVTGLTLFADGCKRNDKVCYFFLFFVKCLANGKLLAVDVVCLVAICSVAYVLYNTFLSDPPSPL
jgi:hypothetical protein